MIFSADTNILLDILIPNQSHIKSSLKILESSTENGSLIICELVYAELASQFDKLVDLNRFLNDTKIQIVVSSKESLFMASRLRNIYVENISNQKYCNECGKRVSIKCPSCSSDLNIPKRILNDFIIGAHAQIFSDSFITRDRGFYRNIFQTWLLFDKFDTQFIVCR